MDLTPNAPIFAALGDEMRLRILARLAQEPMLSITRLTQGTTLTRQAITKHLRILQQVGLVRGHRRGRETIFELNPDKLEEARLALDTIADQWDQALHRLKSFVEENPA